MRLRNLLPRLEFGVQALVRRQQRCPFCQSASHRVVARKYGVVRIRRCSRCSLCFTDPIYKSRIADLYDSWLYAAEGSTTTVPAPAALSELKMNLFDGSDKNCRSQLQALTRLRAGAKLLEIGSSWGYFLYQAQAARFSAVGVEPNTLRRHYGTRELGVDIRPTVADVEDDDFDVVYSAHTLEHISEPGLFLSACHQRLKDGGLLCIEVPHFDLHVRGQRALSIIGAVHPLGLTQSFFEIALPRTGFRFVGAYGDWDAVPSRDSAADRGILIVIAEKASAPATLQ